MVSWVSWVVFLALIGSIEPTIGPGNRKSTTRAPEKPVTTTPPSVQSVPSPSSIRASPPAKSNVLQRNLIQENIDRQTILENHESYCATCVETREFKNPTLVY